MKKVRLLILAAHPYESASTRYRIVQFLPILIDRGILPDFYSFYSSSQFKLIGRQHFIISKLIAAIVSISKLVFVCFNLYKYDVVFISREVINFGPPVIEFIVSRILRIPMVFDFDDALWIKYKSPSIGNIVKYIKSSSKTSQIIKYSSQVIACNDLLAKYSFNYNNQVTIIPTVVDCKKYYNTKSYIDRNDKKLIIGWIGTHSTTQYLDLILDVLCELGKSNHFIFKVIGASRIINITGIDVQNIEWDLTREIEDLCSFDIGVYPIINNEWSLGKCAFKAIQYQAAGVACVASSVGMTNQVILSGVNGLLAQSQDDWYRFLQLLLVNKDYRNSLVRAGYKNAWENYSLDKYAPKLANVILDTAAKQL
jgi:glycosyltransferase involved in cell wall biosynthesis